MKFFGRGRVSEFLGDNIVYRNLEPVDPRLPGLSDIRDEVGLQAGITPRKTTEEYARVMAHILKAARHMDSPGTRIERIVFIGDTRLNDSTAFENICRAGGWPGLAFIGAENDQPSSIEIEERVVGAVFHANRWAALADFQAFCIRQDYKIDESSLLLLDLDKTTLGARGRNDDVINHVRVEAAVQTIRNLLGANFNPQGFQTTYDTFNHTRFHPFTTDNQDYLVYLCLMIGSGIYDRDELVRAVEVGRIPSFDAFMADVDSKSDALSPDLGSIHTDVYRRVRSGDPTPFKAFRRAEYLATVARMGQVGLEATVDELLSQEIVITEEVRSFALAWKAQGALLFGLSDKPDEASIPTPEMAAQGYSPVHGVETSVVGVEEVE